MPIEVSCAECDKELRVKDELAGKKIKCPGCAAVIAVPNGTERSKSIKAKPSPDEGTTPKRKTAAKKTRLLKH